MAEPVGDRGDPVDDGHEVERLVSAAAAGEHVAWDQLVERYAPLLVGVSMRYRLSPTEREDVIQTVWLRLVEHLGELREPRALPMWIVTTTRREALRCLGGRAHLVSRDPQSPVWDTCPSPEHDPVAGLVEAERHQALMEGLGELNPRQRGLLLLLSEDPPVAYAEISRRLDMPVGAIGPTRARALERLRRTPALRSLHHHETTTGGRST